MKLVSMILTFQSKFVTNFTIEIIQRHVKLKQRLIAGWNFGHQSNQKIKQRIEQKNWLWWQRINIPFLFCSHSSFFFSFYLVCSVKTDLMENGANSTLSIAKVRKTDGGNYTCSISSNDYHTINIQVINGNIFSQKFTFFTFSIFIWSIFFSLSILLNRYFLQA